MTHFACKRTNTEKPGFGRSRPSISDVVFKVSAYTDRTTASSSYYCGSSSAPEAKQRFISLVKPRVRGKAIIRSAASGAYPTSGHGDADAFSNLRKQWDQWTDRLVNFANVPFSILVLPQVVQNFANMSAGNNAALGAIVWEGYVSGLLGNTLMCNHFVNRGERSAVNVQVVGMLSNLLVLTQVVMAGCMSKAVYAAVAGLTFTALLINAARLSGALGPSSSSSKGADGAGSGGLGLWRAWQLASGVCGLAVVPQVMYNILVPGSPSILPFVGTLLLSGAYFGIKAAREASAPMVQQLPGLSATLLFALSPLPQMVRNFVDPSGLEGLSEASMLLALTGNCLMVPRALFTQDLIWILGSSWACLAGWLTQISLFIAVSPITGLRYVDLPVFTAVSITLAAYLGLVVYIHRRTALPK